MIKNNKGMTLTELIVSFAIVSVAVIYFTQTLVTVKKIYNESKQKTQAFIVEEYIFRIADKNTSVACPRVKKAFGTSIVGSCSMPVTRSDLNYNYYTFTYNVNGKPYTSVFVKAKP